MTEPRELLEQSKPLPADFDIDEEFEEVLGYWFSHVGRILALTSRHYSGDISMSSITEQ